MTRSAAGSGTMGDVHYIESGAGPALLLLHAFPMDARMWNATRTILEQHARVITPDQRGMGESPMNGSPASQPTSLDQAAWDVIALLDVLELDDVVLGGCSMGGYVAMAVARLAPERLKGLIFIDTKAAADNAEQHENRLAVASRAEADGTEGWLADSMVPNLLGSTTQRDRPDVTSVVRDMIETQPAEGVAWAQRAMAARPDSTDTLRDLKSPALVLVGEEDTLTPPDEARTLAAALADSQFAIVPGAGHLSPIETPDAFAAAVTSWLAKVG